MKPDSDYKCVMIPRPDRIATLKPTTFRVEGVTVEIPSRILFVMDDGSVYVQVKKRGEVVEFASLDYLIKAVKGTRVIQNFSIQHV